MAASTPSAPRVTSSPSDACRNPAGRRLRSPGPAFLCPLPKERSAGDPDALLCRCQHRPDPASPRPGWDSALRDAARSAVKWWNENVMVRDSLREAGSDGIGPGRDDRGEWDWERWMRHFEEVEEQERLVGVLKSQLVDAVHREDYGDAAKLKVAVAAAARKDVVGQAISRLRRAVKEERYKDAAFIRDHAGAGLLGWWAGIAEDSTDPYGRIIHIIAEHGRYVARSYSSRQLATAMPGIPLFEIYFTINDEGEYRQRAVYLKRNKRNPGFLPKRWRPSDVITLNPFSDSAEGKTDSSIPSADDVEDTDDADEDSDVAGGLAGIQSILRDMIPGAKVKVLTVIGPGKVDKDSIFKALEHDLEEADEEEEGEDEEEEEQEQGEEDEDDNHEHEDVVLGGIDYENKLHSENLRDEIHVDDGSSLGDSPETQKQMAVKVVIGGLVQKLSSEMTSKAIRVPARLEKLGRKAFSLSVEKDERQEKAGNKRDGPAGKTAATSGQRSIDIVMSDLAKVLVSKEKIPMKVLRDVGELINLTLSQAQNQQPLSGSTVFQRIEIPMTSDPLNGLYIGAHGVYTSEIIHLRRKFGQWDEGGDNKSQNLEFYEYVEALKLTGDPYVPAGQVAFRAKVGKRNQLPHKGIIPEEFGVVARYKGQGRLAEPGFRNPRWVDGELVILDGKYIKGGPVVGFIYWAPEYHFLVFFHRLRLQD